MVTRYSSPTLGARERRQLLDILINRDLWKISLGQALTQAVRPRSVMAPILFGIGVEMDHVLGSVWAVGTLFDHGFSVS